MKITKSKKGFTLIELLVVIAIIAILAVVVILTLNPAELLRQARDSNRVSDFATLKSAIALYSTDVATTTPLYQTAYVLYSSYGSATSGTSTYESSTNSNWWGFLGTEGALSATGTRSVAGTGWVPLNFNAISSGAPIGTLPVDPVNLGPNFYVYAASSTVFKLATKMESVKYGTAGGGDVVTNDGGNSTSTYEQGTNLTGL
jgi:prepilin-type N-terminal cleavage/methylation domain-containing protein